MDDDRFRKHGPDDGLAAWRRGQASGVGEEDVGVDGRHEVTLMGEINCTLNSDCSQKLDCFTYAKTFSCYQNVLALCVLEAVKSVR